MAVGVDYDRGRLFVAGGGTGDGYVYDAETGAPIAVYDFTSAASFVNDVIVTRTDAWFTDSLSPVLYRVPLGPDGSPGHIQSKWCRSAATSRSYPVSSTPTGSTPRRTV